MDKQELISLNEAAAKGITKVRKPTWALPSDHIQLTIVGGKPGPWLKLFSVINEEINGRNPVPFMMDGDPDAKIFLEYKEPQACHGCSSCNCKR